MSIKVMIDTNILISAIVFRGEALKILLRLAELNIDIYLSDYIEKEFVNKIKDKWPAESKLILDLYHELNYIVLKSSPKILCTLRDKKDEQVLSDAIYNQINFLLTGDKDFCDCDNELVKIVSISELNDILNNMNNK